MSKDPIETPLTRSLEALLPELDYAYSEERNGIISIRYQHGTKYHYFNVKWGGHRTFSLSADEPTRTKETDFIAQKLWKLNENRHSPLSPPPYSMTEGQSCVTIHHIGAVVTGGKKNQTYTAASTPEEILELAKNFVWITRSRCEDSFQVDLAEIALTLGVSQGLHAGALMATFYRTDDTREKFTRSWQRRRNLGQLQNLLPRQLQIAVEYLRPRLVAQLVGDGVHVAGELGSVLHGSFTDVVLLRDRLPRFRVATVATPRYLTAVRLLLKLKMLSDPVNSLLILQVPLPSWYRSSTVWLRPDWVAKSDRHPISGPVAMPSRISF